MEDRLLCPEGENYRIFRLEAGCKDREIWLDRLRDLDREIFPNSPWGREAFQKNTENSFDTLLLCGEEERLLGYGLLRCLDAAELLILGVRKECRNRGIGTALLRELLPYGEGLPVWLEVREGNLAARKLYARQGFLEEGRRKGYYKDPKEDAILMKRDPGPAGELSEKGEE